jgi:hypothetical protein
MAREAISIRPAKSMSYGSGMKCNDRAERPEFGKLSRGGMPHWLSDEEQPGLRSEWTSGVTMNTAKQESRLVFCSRSLIRRLQACPGAGLVFYRSSQVFPVLTIIKNARKQDRHTTITADHSGSASSFSSCATASGLSHSIDPNKPNRSCPCLSTT